MKQKLLENLALSSPGDAAIGSGTPAARTRSQMEQEAALDPPPPPIALQYTTITQKGVNRSQGSSKHPGTLTLGMQGIMSYAFGGQGSSPFCNACNL